MSIATPLGRRLALYYAALFIVTGIQLPFWPLYLSSKGLTAPDIGRLLAAAYLAKIVTNPVIGHLADRWGTRRGLIAALAAVSLAATALFAPAEGFLAILAVTLVSQAAYTAIMPLGDSLTMQCTISHRLDYGRIRLWGSLSFIVTASLAGHFLTQGPRAMILWTSLAALAVNLVVTFWLPDVRMPRTESRPASLRPLLRNRLFQLFLACCSLGQASHMIYYGFATLHWRTAGLSGTIIGGLWAEGVIAEVLLFAFGARAVTRFGPASLMMAMGAAGVLRWCVMAFTTAAPVLALVQLLHAFTFAAGHLGAMHFIGRAVPGGLSARAQGIYAAVVTGVASGIAMLAAGSLYQALAGWAFLVMAMMSVASTLLALALKHRWNGRSLEAAPE
jgi:PPP family 3-phenylpropionic acid transporter